MKKKLHYFLVFCLNALFVCIMYTSQAQRQYASQSVLASGSWYKLCTKKEGIYKIDLPFLNNLGINTNNLSASSIQLFGNGGYLLSENNATIVADDLLENAIDMYDGGDGIFNGDDYFLFYAASADKWLKDSSTQKFNHQKNIYTDSVIYFLKIGTNGKRMSNNNIVATPNKIATTFNERYFYENDWINFLNSGKEWFGEEFSNLPGNNLSRSYVVDLNNLDFTQPIQFASNFASRSVNGSSSFNVSINNQLVQNINMGSVSGNFLEPFVTNTLQRTNCNINNSVLNIAITYNSSVIGAQGWLNWFEINARKNLKITNNAPLYFRDWQSVAAGNVTQFVVSNSLINTLVWDITNPLIPEKISTNFINNQTTFITTTNILKEFVAFNNNNYLLPVAIGKIDNQNLHNSSIADYIIISHPIFISEANRLALFHRQHYQYKVVVVSTSEIYNEFSGGIADVTAIRNFVKMYYDKAAGNVSKTPKYLLLFGASSFDFKNRINNNTNFVPCYESVNSIDPLLTYTTDDFFALLKDADDINSTTASNQLDIAVGRIPITTLDEAKNTVDKIINYHSKQSLGAWRNNIIFTADDKDYNTHLNDAEAIATNAYNTNNLLNQSKIYLDAYPMVSGSGGTRYPAVNTAIVNQINAGALFFNYNGHGGYNRLAEEAILGKEEANQFNNPNKLPVFITATCDFVPHDDPTKNALGTTLLVTNQTGAIALVTTTRVVFAYSNRILNDNFLKTILQKNAAQKFLSLGEAVRQAKNTTYQNFSDAINNRKFTLIGDPAIQLSFPSLNIQVSSINNHAISIKDTLQPLNKYAFAGKITDENGLLLNNFNGTIYPTLFDKTQAVSTLGNDAQSLVVPFNQQTNVIYRGKATIQNGLFNFSFIVPKDINNKVGNGRLSLYAENGETDASGLSTSFLVGGSTNNSLKDNEGPIIKIFLNDEKFASGGLVNENPVLIVHLFDSSGINTSGLGIGHDIIATIDGDEKNSIVLNNFYEATLNNYQKGIIHYSIHALSEGVHYLKIKAWDVVNNSNEAIIEFVVAKQKQLTISNVLNYPNPFSTSTNFWFNHNQPNTNLNVLINIYTISGKLVHQISRNINTEGNIVNNIFWDGKDKYYQKLARGVYIYRIIVSNYLMQQAQSTQKLFLF